MDETSRSRLIDQVAPMLGLWLPALLLFMDWFLAADTVRGKLVFLFQQTNEHRLVFDRIVVLGQYCLTGWVDFSELTRLGNGILLVFVLQQAGRLRKMGFDRLGVMVLNGLHAAIQWQPEPIQIP